MFDWFCFVLFYLVGLFLCVFSGHCQDSLPYSSSFSTVVLRYLTETLWFFKYTSGEMHEMKPEESDILSFSISLLNYRKSDNNY